MPRPSAATTAAAAALLLASAAQADIYMHNPPGSNNRNRERNANRNNANRMFDSQNNDKGGYPWRGDRELLNAPDPLAYYEGSILRVEWTAQHACGDDPTTFCTVTLQCVPTNGRATMRYGCMPAFCRRAPTSRRRAPADDPFVLPTLYPGTLAMTRCPASAMATPAARSPRRMRPPALCTCRAPFCATARMARTPSRRRRWCAGAARQGVRGRGTGNRPHWLARSLAPRHALPCHSDAFPRTCDHR
jgi:hypothetical protein